ncbi:GntR family transcriptional regulator [Pseudarthrobacter oxydans]|uniref:GntR family transcriptional regulator n=1 Tax=Pseudarthrobacter oxydans TaxID=1671 RepID=UPI002AA73E6F|nr:GntR family transcriptional regulator [Pseudarthrobacter oxydans]WPU09467.1 GntR family transcriptional regulator [Pseudarthrobacter oxydans]
MKRGALDPVVQESTPAIIARRIREAIARGDFAPGIQLGEAELAKELGVSRGPLREAMQRLTQEGLLVSHRNRGLFVVTMDEDDFRDVYLARTAVEAAAISRVASTNPEGNAAKLMEAVHAMEDTADSPNSEAMTEADMSFHALLVELAGSPRLKRMHDTLLTETRMCLNALKSTYHTADRRIAEHKGIAEAISRGDADLAEKLMAEHMDDALMRLIP